MTSPDAEPPPRRLRLRPSAAAWSVSRTAHAATAHLLSTAQYVSPGAHGSTTTTVRVAVALRAGLCWSNTQKATSKIVPTGAAVSRQPRSPLVAN